MVIELRHVFGWLYDENLKKYDELKEVDIYAEIVDEFMATNEALSIKLIACSLRMINVEEQKSQLEIVFQMK